jgi:hypothetical protein
MARIVSSPCESGFFRRGFASDRRALSETRKCLQTTLRQRKRPHGVQRPAIVLTFLNLLQLILYIPLLALLGQGLLFVLAGAKRNENFFYQLLQLISKPFTFVVRKLTPAKVGDSQVPIVTFFLLVIVYAVVSFEKINLCVQIGLEQCK